MSKFSRGDRVLVEAVLRSHHEEGMWTLADGSCANDNKVHPHPGVPVASLVEEADSAGSLLNDYVRGLPISLDRSSRHQNLRDARLAAQKPVPSGTEKVIWEEVAKLKEITDEDGKWDHGGTRSGLIALRLIALAERLVEQIEQEQRIAELEAALREAEPWLDADVIVEVLL